MISLPIGRIRGLLIITGVVGIGALIAPTAAATIRQAVSLSLDHGLLNPSFLLMLVPFAVCSYGLRILRWHTLVRRLVPGSSLVTNGYTQIVGFAFSATPGRIAELYKLKLLEHSTRLPIAQSLPAAIVERLTDVAAFSLLAVIGGLFDWSESTGAGSATRWILLLLGLAILASVYHLGWRHRGRFEPPPTLAPLYQRVAKRARALPGISRLSTILSQLKTGGSQVGSPSIMAFALACVVIGRLGDGVILWQIARAVGYPVSFSMALLMIGSAGLVGGITFSPGGLGATEATLVGLIMAHGAPLGAAMVTALGARTLIYWLWVLVGLCVFVVGQSKHIAGWDVPRSQDRAYVEE